MAFFDIKNSIPITLVNCKQVNHIAFDGCYYYFTIMCHKEVIKCSKNFCVQQCYDTCRKYDCICYDYKEHCFWASVKNYYNCLFKLDCYMNEIDCMEVDGCSEVAGVITGLSYNFCKDVIIVSFSCGIVEVDKSSGKCTKLYYLQKGLVTSVMSICPGYIFTILKNKKQYIYMINQHGKVLKRKEISCNGLIKNMIFNPCLENCDEYFIDFLIMKKCYAYMFRQPIGGYLEYQPCNCNFKICDECCCNKPSIPCIDECGDILESIALMEAALSHIINAEGEKLQKVLKCTNDIDKIYCINKNINETIVNATHLEHVLFDKLDIISKSFYEKLPPFIDPDIDIDGGYF